MVRDHAEAGKPVPVYAVPWNGGQKKEPRLHSQELRLIEQGDRMAMRWAPGLSRPGPDSYLFRLGHLANVGQWRFPPIRIRLPGVFLRHGRQDKHVVALLPIDGCRHFLCGRQLAGIEQS